MTFFRNMLFFAYTVFLAVSQEWKAADIIWSMWMASLLVGGLCIFTAIAFNGILRKGEITADDIVQMAGRRLPPETLEKIAKAQLEKGFRVPRVAAFCITVFLLLFFAAHFGGFHYAHSLFLRDFFPLEGLGKKAPLADYIAESLHLYWPFLIVSLAGYGDILMRNLRGHGALSMIEPYKNVIKNHGIIIATGILSLIGLEGHALYLVLVFYFFPYEETWQAIRKDREKAV